MQIKKNWQNLCQFGILRGIWLFLLMVLEKELKATNKIAEEIIKEIKQGSTFLLDCRFRLSIPK